MRADRLISTLLILQRRGQVTATEVADELEVSVRTARRDLEALGTAGLPVYSVPGRGGGWRLMGDGRTDLSGLSSREAVSLFALIGANSAHHQPETAAALRKLIRALPAPMRDVAERAADSIRITPASVDQGLGHAAPDPHVLAQVRESVVRQRRARLAYLSMDSGRSTRDIDPLGLVAQGPRWYLIAMTEAGQRTFRVDRIEEYSVLDEPAQRPDSFDVDHAWSTIAANIDELRWAVEAEVRINRDAVGRARFVLGERLVWSDSPDEPQGQVLARVRGRSMVELGGILAGLHPWVWVTGPSELVTWLTDLGAALVRDHGAHPEGDQTEHPLKGWESPAD